jgi:hypothetical protein
MTTLGWPPRDLIRDINILLKGYPVRADWEQPRELLLVKQARDRIIELGQDNDALVAALRDLLKYGDDHDWGHMPEGSTIDRARAALAAVEKE